MTTNPFHSELISSDNDEIAGDDGFLTDNSDLGDIIVYSRDWTVETVVNQIVKGNIDLNPEFQRRNAWNDKKKSSLIESYLIGYPVPEIVLAEHPREKKKFIVIDGKQRLLSLCGFILPNKYESWKSEKLKDLKDLKELNNKSFNDLQKEPELSKYLRLLANSDVRCTVISNVKNDEILYDIFYRLNAGATPLSVQELRQVLYNGPFTKFLIDYTSEIRNIHHVLKLDKPDDRLKDAETILRILSMLSNITRYTGNLKRHLDEFTIDCNDGWEVAEENILQVLDIISEAIDVLKDKLGSYSIIGRRFNNEKNCFDNRFNTVIFEVQIYFAFYGLEELKQLNNDTFLDNFKGLFDITDFSNSVTSSTKNIKEYSTRYKIYGEMFERITGKKVNHPWMD